MDLSTETKAVAKPDASEIAISDNGRDISVPFMGALREMRDTVLRRLGNNFESYRELRRDDQVHACFQQRRLAVTSRPLVITPGADDARSVAAADHLRENLAQIAFDRSCDKMMWGAFYGHGVAECMWEIRDGKVWLARAKVRTPWRFRYGQAGDLRLLTRTNMTVGEILLDRKFWTVSWGADNDDDPYGLGLAHQLYWPVYFKKQGLGFWLRALEKFGAPSTIAKYPAGSGPEVRNQALQLARQLRIDGAAAMPDTMILELLEAARGAVDQVAFHRQMQSAIAKIVLGQTMTTDDGASLSQSEVHMEVREELTDTDCELLCESLQNGPATWMTEWNYPGAAVPIVTRPSPEDQAAAAELLEKKGKAVKAMREAGLEPENDEALQAFVGPGWKITVPPAAPAAVPGNPALKLAFAESGGADAVDDFTADLGWEQVMAPIVERISTFVAGRPDLQAAADQLGLLLAEPTGAAMVEVIARAVFEARLAGEGGVALDEAQAAADSAAA